MNNMANMANMAGMGAMGGPVGAAMPMMNNNGALPHQGDPRHQLNDANRTLLNTYIYEYFMRYGMYDCARQIYAVDPEINVKKDGGRRDDNGNPIGNGIGDDPMDTDSKDLLDQKRPDDLPAPNLPSTMPGSCFLYEWFCLFWDMFNSQKGKGSSAQINQYVSHTQQQSRIRQQEQQAMLRNLRPPGDYAQQQYPAQMMGRLPNGAMNMNKMQVNQLQRAAMANSQNPQAMQMMQQKAAQMQRDPSDMDGNRVRPTSPGSTDNAPSPSKRPRLDGAPFNPNQAVMMPNGRPAQGMPGQQQLQAFVSTNPNIPNKASIATYSANLQQHHGNQMPGKTMANAGGPQGQGSPMVPQGPDAASLGQFYNPGDLAPGTNMRPGGPNQQTGSNHALQDYQMQLMLLEQQNKKRLMMARQEQDVGGSMQRPDGPGGPPGAAPGPGQNFQGTSPPGGRSGASPNPADMKRASQQMGNAANMGSPLPDGAQNRSSPNSMNFIGGNIGPDGKSHFFNGVGMEMAGQMNGMRPPSSHPPFNGQMNQQLMAAARQQQAQQQQQQQGGQGGPGMNWQQGGPNGQMAGQPPQGQVQGTPRQGAMPPPSAPAVAATAASSRNATSSPQTSTAAPPTPQQGTKANPSKKKDNKAKSKTAAQKKTGANVNAGATPAAEPEATQEPPTPATPITPVNAASFAKNQNVNPAQAPNGQPAAPAAPPPVAAVPPAPLADQNRGTNFMDTTSTGIEFSMDFANPLTSDNVLTDFDFDSFLHDNNGGDESTFDFGAGFMEGGEIVAD
ncbi:hypothetical protein B0T16DRAFT_194879 [Cercophora newfieldiana]|uniref:LisH domain-containing protein n=1 Tax=Cercophora newfieldiana TaxID=92897 RepID=A0AA40CMR7_9PEZI|nr:hypothetical protein B0T16DRAFT_194879 [Cercophora newfieldiana]